MRAASRPLARVKVVESSATVTGGRFWPVATLSAQKKFQTRNPKAEIRRPKEIRNPKSEKPLASLLPGRVIGTSCGLARWPFLGLRISGFGLLSDFGLRISDLRAISWQL